MLKRLIFWEFPRGGWQYDVVVGIILAFIFLTPRAWFGDEPRIAKASPIAEISSENGVSTFYIDAELLGGIADDQLKSKLGELLSKRTGGKQLSVTEFEPVKNSEGQTQGYMATARR
jgi:hypothetical protein